MKWLIVIGVLVIGVIAYRKFQSTGDIGDQTRMHSWAGAFWGALIGCFFGIAGFGGAIAATIPGALIGYFLAPVLLRSRDVMAASDRKGRSRSSVGDSPEQVASVQPLSDSYHERIAHLRYSTAEGHILSVTGHQVLALDETAMRAHEDAEKRMDADLQWWYEGEPKRWHVFLKNYSSSPIVVVCLDITPGPSHSPTGPTNCVYIKLHSQIPPNIPFVVVFPTPRGSVDNLDVQDCSLHSAYGIAP
jgi:hypothetical protein